MLILCGKYKDVLFIYLWFFIWIVTVYLIKVYLWFVLGLLVVRLVFGKEGGGVRLGEDEGLSCDRMGLILSFSIWFWEVF